MDTKTMLKHGSEYNMDLDSLYKLAKKELEGIDVEIRTHPAFEAEPKAKELLGYYPAGEKQVLFGKAGKRISCIRGMASFGLLEILGDGTGEVERFDTEREVVDRIKEIWGG